MEDESEKSQDWLAEIEKLREDNIQLKRQKVDLEEENKNQAEEIEKISTKLDRYKEELKRKDHKCAQQDKASKEFQAKEKLYKDDRHKMRCTFS